MTLVAGGRSGQSSATNKTKFAFASTLCSTHTVVHSPGSSSYIEDLRVDRIEGLVKTAAPLSCSSYTQTNSVQVVFAILEIQFPYFVDFWLLSLKYITLSILVSMAFQF
jgi:hypothetical protein